MLQKENKTQTETGYLVEPPKSFASLLPYGLWLRLIYVNTFLLTISENSSRLSADTLKDKLLLRAMRLPVMKTLVLKFQNVLEKRIINNFLIPPKTDND